MVRSWIASRVRRHLPSRSRGNVKRVTIKYDINQLASKSVTTRYDIFITVTKSVTALYDTINKVAKTKSIVYDFAGSVLKTLTTVYGTTGGTGFSPFQGNSPEDASNPNYVANNVAETFITAKLVAPLNHNCNVDGRMRAKYYGSIRAFTSKFYKANVAGEIYGTLRCPLEHATDTNGKLVDALHTAKCKCKLSFAPVMEMINRNLQILSGKLLAFTFESIREPAFQHGSSFVGVVVYNPDFNSMQVVLNGNQYNYCNVPFRIFTAFKGADSKGAYYNRSIKGQYVC
mgnify:CR=1 FL=1|jgi:hypothetical protein